jgi:two-component system NtrC family sensor kinase
MNLRVGPLIALGFAGIVALFALAAVQTIASLRRLDSLEVERVAHDEARHEGLETRAAIQEQYIHQAHTLIAGDESHLDHYLASERAVAERLERLRAACSRIGFAMRVDALESIVSELGTAFGLHVVPLVAERERGGAASQKLAYHHARLEGLTSRAGAAIDELNAAIEDAAEVTARRFAALLDDTRTTIVGTLLAALLAALALSFALVRGIGKPVLALHRALERASREHLGERVAESGPRELRELIGGFNRMTGALIESRERVARQARLAAIGEVAAGVAHEINNPLGVVKGYLAVLRRGDVAGELAADLAVIEDEIDRCAAIVRGLLDLSRHDREPRVPVDLSALLRDAVARRGAAQAGDSAAPRIELDDAGGEVEIDGSPRGLRQAVDNLIANACEAARPSGLVRLGLEVDRDAIRINVDDDGPGVPDDVRPRLFAPFFTTRPRGTGLGLAISDRLVRDHGGGIEVARSPLGGARFTILLPRQRRSDGAAGEAAT